MTPSNFIYMLDNVIYIRMRASLLSFKNVSQGLYFEDVPLIALSKKDSKTLAFGKSAEIYQSNPNAKVINAFGHIRSIIDDYEAAEKTLQQFIKQVLRKKLWRFIPVRPTVIFHPLEKLEGGLTQVEGRALIDCGYRLKAEKVYVWTGRDLTDDEVRHGKFLSETELIK